MNPKVAKHLTKLALSLVGSAILGAIVKMEHKVEDRIDEHYDRLAEESNDPPEPLALEA